MRLSLALAGLAVALASAPGAARAWDPPALSEDATPPIAVTPDEAARAYREAREVGATDPHRALRALDVVLAFAPELHERLALARGDLWIAAGDPRAACAAYAEARRADEPGLVVHAEVGAVRCLLAAADPRGDAALTRLLADHPSLPDALALREESARAAERRGELARAAAAYVALDVEEPGSSAAARAREDLVRLMASGVPVPSPTGEQRVARVEHLVRSGPHQLALDAATALHAETGLPAELRARVALALARIDRADGRTAEARALVAEAHAAAQGTAALDADAFARDLAADDGARAEAAARRAIRATTRGRTLSRLPAHDLARVVALAAQAGLAEDANAALDALDAARDATGPVRFESAILAAGVADDARLAALLAPATGDPTVGTAARYHRARALERLGRRAESKEELRRVIADDRSELGWYALWARQRLRAMDPPPSPPLALLAMHGDVRLAVIDPPRAPDVATDAPTLELEAPAAVDDAPAGPAPEDLAHAIAILAEIAGRRGGAYPALRRALALARVGDAEGATDELFETSVLYRQVHGRPVPNAGIEAVYRGLVRRGAPDGRVRLARLALSEPERARLAVAADLLGDPGAASALGGRRARLPRPYEPYVRAAAARHHLDPDLLFAVMRVESVYNRRIVSPAGAIGLLQIMPRTGRLIAGELGDADFTPADLLDPQTNVELAAWYLESLLTRFDGRLPLAVAAYNGGPHNVRRWLSQVDPDMPLDAFLERIPFTETHRYVRRVLGHYAAYKAQGGADVAVLDTTLPRPDADRIGF